MVMMMLYPVASRIVPIACLVLAACSAGANSKQDAATLETGQENQVASGPQRPSQAVSEDLRTDQADIRSALADWPDDGSTEFFDYREVKFNDDGSYAIVEHYDVELTKAEAEALLMELEGQIASMGQFDQRSMYTLQNMVQKFQQAMNIASNIMKQQHETEKAIIQNVRA